MAAYAVANPQEPADPCVLLGARTTAPRGIVVDVAMGPWGVQTHAIMTPVTKHRGLERQDEPFNTFVLAPRPGAPAPTHTSNPYALVGWIIEVAPGKQTRLDSYDERYGTYESSLGVHTDLRVTPFRVVRPGDEPKLTAADRDIAPLACTNVCDEEGLRVSDDGGEPEDARFVLRGKKLYVTTPTRTMPAFATEQPVFKWPHHRYTVVTVGPRFHERRMARGDVERACAMAVKRHPAYLLGVRARYRSTKRTLQGVVERYIEALSMYEMRLDDGTTVKLRYLSPRVRWTACV